MFKKVARSKGSPVFLAEMRYYVVARDDEKYARWSLDVGKKLRDIIETSKAESEENKGEEVATDIIFGSLDVAKEEMGSSSKLPSREQPGKYFDAPYRTSFCMGMRYFAGTRSGRPLTDDERKRLVKGTEKVFSCVASLVGAIYMECEIDGKKSVWYDDESCYEACEIPADKLAKPNTMDEIARMLKKQGTDIKDVKRVLNEAIKDIGDAEPSDEADKELGEKIIGFLKDFEDAIKEISEM